jgi:hypothetical protein
MIYDLNKILKQIEDQNEYSLTPQDMNHPLYWVWVAKNTKLKDLESFLRPLRSEHARFDIFINGQYISEKDYVMEGYNADILVKFKKINFVNAYNITENDNIVMKGDFEIL